MTSIPCSKSVFLYLVQEASETEEDGEEDGDTSPRELQRKKNEPIPVTLAMVEKWKQGAMVRGNISWVAGFHRQESLSLPRLRYHCVGEKSVFLGTIQ